MTKQDVKWIAPDNYDGTKTLKLHAFVPAVQRRWITREEYSGNRALCKNVIRISDQDTEDESIEWALLDNGAFDESKACKACLKAFNKLQNEQQEVPDRESNNGDRPSD